MLNACPHHKFSKWQLVNTFYNGLNDPLHTSIDAATGDTIMEKSLDVAYNIIEVMATNYYLERTMASRETSKVHSIDAISVF